VANLISVLRICEQIETNKETIEKNSDQGECNDRIKQQMDARQL
jgi:hypothetical protein